MKEYPSILSARELLARADDYIGAPFVAFDKLDGSNIRAEWACILESRAVCSAHPVELFLSMSSDRPTTASPRPFSSLPGCPEGRGRPWLAGATALDLSVDAQGNPINVPASWKTGDSIIITGAQASLPYYLGGAMDQDEEVKITDIHGGKFSISATLAYTHAGGATSHLTFT